MPVYLDFWTSGLLKGMFPIQDKTKLNKFKIIKSPAVKSRVARLF